MRGIDDDLDSVVRQPFPQAVHPAESPHAHLADRQQGFAHAAGERGDDVESSLAGREGGQFPGFPGAAQNQRLQGCPLK
ncbi:hypothetical protein Ntsu_43240 [Nocardia sp. IFM 10818]